MPKVRILGFPCLAATGRVAPGEQQTPHPPRHAPCARAFLSDCLAVPLPLFSRKAGALIRALHFPRRVWLRRESTFLPPSLRLRVGGAADARSRGPVMGPEVSSPEARPQDVRSAEQGGGFSGGSRVARPGRDGEPADGGQERPRPQADVAARRPGAHPGGGSVRALHTNTEERGSKRKTMDLEMHGARSTVRGVLAGWLMDARTGVVGLRSASGTCAMVLASITRSWLYRMLCVYVSGSEAAWLLYYPGQGLLAL